MALGTQLILRVQVPPGVDKRKLTKHDLLEHITNIIIHNTFIEAFHQTCDLHKLVHTLGFHDIMLVGYFPSYWHSIKHMVGIVYENNIVK